MVVFPQFGSFIFTNRLYNGHMRIKALSCALLALLVWYATASNADGGAYIFAPNSVTENLSQRTVRQVFQDSKGFIWVLTQEGLNRFDGRTVSIYRSDFNDPGSISANDTRGILEDSEGNVWIGTSGGGLDKYLPATDSFQGLRAGPDESGVTPERIRAPISNRIWSLSKGPDGLIWVGYRDGGLSVFHPQTGLFRHMEAFQELNDGFPVVDVEIDTDGTAWIATSGNGVFRLDSDMRTIQRFAATANAAFLLPSDKISDIQRDSSGRLWISVVKAGVYRFDVGDSRMRPVNTLLNPEDLEESFDQVSAALNVHEIYEDSRAQIWFATQQGVGLYHSDIDAIEMFTKKNTGLSQASVLSILEDRNSRYWIGTFSGVDNAFESPFNAVTTNTGLSEGTVLAITQSEDGSTWVGTQGGLHRFKPNAEMVRKNLDALDYLDLSPPPFTSLFAQDGKIWAGTFENGLDEVDTERGLVVHHRHSPDDAASLSANGVTSVLSDRRGNLWVGTYGGGLNMKARGATGFKRFVHHENDPSLAE